MVFPNNNIINICIQYDLRIRTLIIILLPRNHSTPDRFGFLCKPTPTIGAHIILHWSHIFHKHTHIRTNEIIFEIDRHNSDWLRN